MGDLWAIIVEMFGLDNLIALIDWIKALFA